MGLLQFLFGKKPKILFTEEGRTRHDLDEDIWKAWKERFAKNPEYDWQKHVGKSGRHFHELNQKNKK